MAVLDTTFLIDLEERLEGAMSALDDLRSTAEPLRVPAAVWVEYLFRMPAATRAKMVRALEPIVLFEPFERAHANEAVRLQHEMHAAGRTLAWHDLQVAATAVLHDELLVTNDKAFGRVPGLRTLGH